MSAFLAHLREQKPFLEIRGRLFRSVRTFFDTAGYLEVETPVRIDAPAPEANIEAPAVYGGGFLRTSPELQMKMMLASGYEKIYQMGSCFRENERGRKHSEEFTLLEWYCAGQTDHDILTFTAALLKHIGETFGRNTWTRYDVLTVEEAFRRYAHADAFKALHDGTFDEILVTQVEPELGRTRPLFLTDYPAEAAAFARLRTGNPRVSERWELYIEGMELANAYGELTDPVIQRERFTEFDALRRASGGKPYPEATHFLEALDAGIPASAGCALGMDRLTMLLTGANHISQVRMI